MGSAKRFYQNHPKHRKGIIDHETQPDEQRRTEGSKSGAQGSPVRGTGQGMERSAMTAPLSKAMQSFVTGYIDAALWSSCCSASFPGENDPSLKSMEGFPLSDDGRDKLTRYATSWACENIDLLAQAKANTGYDWPRIGHDLWLTQAGHGAGFWDGDYRGLDAWGKPFDHGEALTDAAQKYTEYTLYVGDDGLVYVD